MIQAKNQGAMLVRSDTVGDNEKDNNAPKTSPMPRIPGPKGRVQNQNNSDQNGPNNKVFNVGKTSKGGVGNIREGLERTIE